MIAAMADIRAQHGVILTELNIGGGHGDPLHPAVIVELNLDELAAVIEDALDEACAAEHFPRPTVVVEPGRAISGRAGVTLYRVCSVKTQPGGRTFVAVDGGMSDNPRVSLYGAQYTVALANRPPLGRQAARHRGRPALRSGRRDRPRHRATGGRPSRRPAGRGVHRRLSPQHGVELQHGRPPAAGGGQGRPGPRAGATRDRCRPAGPATAVSRASATRPAAGGRLPGGSGRSTSG